MTEQCVISLFSIACSNVCINFNPESGFDCGHSHCESRMHFEWYQLSCGALTPALLAAFSFPFWLDTLCWWILSIFIWSNFLSIACVWVFLDALCNFLIYFYYLGILYLVPIENIKYKPIEFDKRKTFFTVITETQRWCLSVGAPDACVVLINLQDLLCFFEIASAFL